MGRLVPRVSNFKGQQIWLKRKFLAKTRPKQFFNIYQKIYQYINTTKYGGGGENLGLPRAPFILVTPLMFVGKYSTPAVTKTVCQRNIIFPFQTFIPWRLETRLRSLTVLKHWYRRFFLWNPYFKLFHLQIWTSFSVVSWVVCHQKASKQKRGKSAVFF